MAAKVLRARVTKLEDMLGGPLADPEVTIVATLQPHSEEMKEMGEALSELTEKGQSLQESHDKLVEDLHTRFATLSEEVQSLVAVMKTNMEDLAGDVNLVKKAMRSQPHELATSKVKISEHKPFHGV